MSFVKKGTKVYSIFYNKCPRCNEGDFFYSHPYHLKKFGKKHDNCEVCDLKFEKEPGFFFGSMYISYGLGVGFFIAWWLVKSTFFPEMKAEQMILLMALFQMGFAPLNLYLSKLTWLNLFVKFDKEYTSKNV
ncbi:MAG: DUF983 domain-containing protein [Flavobacteriales bacterium]